MLLAALLGCFLLGEVADPSANVDRPHFFLLERQVSQLGGRWVLDYTVRYDGIELLELTPADLQVDYQATVSNSQSEPHVFPRDSAVTWCVGDGHSKDTLVLASKGGSGACHERLAIAMSRPVAAPAADTVSAWPFAVEPGCHFSIRFEIKHEHFLYGMYEPLLGTRQIEMRFGPHRFRDTVTLDAELAPASPVMNLAMPEHYEPDTDIYHSQPDSIVLYAHEGGRQFFRFEDVPVRRSTVVKLSFWYALAGDSKAEARVRVVEYQDTPNAWYRVGEPLDEELAVRGRWTYFDRELHTTRDANSLVIDFRLVGSDVGAMWIDDAVIVPLRPEDGTVSLPAKLLALDELD